MRENLISCLLVTCLLHLTDVSSRTCEVLWMSVLRACHFSQQIDVSNMLGIAYIEVMTWSPTYSNCSWMISMWLFDPPCCWRCHPCSLCSQLLYRSFTASWLLCCLLHSCHNEGTVVLTMWLGACWDDVMMNVDVSFFHVPLRMTECKTCINF